MSIKSIDLGLGPDAVVLALSEFAAVPGPGVVLVDLNGRGMLYTASVWLDEAGHVSEGGWGTSSSCTSLVDDCVSVTGRVTPDVHTVVVHVTSGLEGKAFSFEVSPGPSSWYAGCRPLPSDLRRFQDLAVTVIERT